MIGAGGRDGSGGATVAGGSGGVASGGTTGTVVGGAGGVGVGGAIGSGGAGKGGAIGSGGAGTGGAIGGGGAGTGGLVGSGGSATGGRAAGGTGGTVIDGATGSACNGAAKSSLPGVSIAFPDGPCSFTLAEVAAGISLNYELRIERSLDGVHPVPLDYGSCGQPDATGLIVGFEIAGTGGRYCLCDVGPCGRRTFSTRAPAGTYPSTIPWDGRNWMGPSDTFNPKGSAFPPGTYTLTVTAKGTWDGPGSCDSGLCSADGGAVLDYQVTAERFITITP